MASIWKRYNKKKDNWVYRVQIRRKGLPIFCLTFSTELEATIWIRLNEKEYIKNPELYIDFYERKKLEMRREREFNV